MVEEGEQTQGTQTETAEGQEQAQGQQSGGEQQEGVASRYSQRVQQLANETKAAREEASAVKKELEELRAWKQQQSLPAEERARQEKIKQISEKFYKDPAAYVAETEERIRSEFQQLTARQQDLASYQSHSEQLMGSPGFSKELEAAMVKVLQDNGLTDPRELDRFGRTRALKFAYQGATGKPWGDWNKDAYNIRQTKERLMRPGGGGSPAMATMDPDAYRAATRALAHKNMSQEEQTIEAQKLDAKLEAWYAANQQ